MFPSTHQGQGNKRRVVKFDIYRIPMDNFFYFSLEIFHSPLPLSVPLLHSLVLKTGNKTLGLKYIPNQSTMEMPCKEYQILECLAEIVWHNIIKEVKGSEAFSVLADETKNKKEQISLVLKYYCKGAVQFQKPELV
ncbi:hypothetical protein N1851_020075 [Merluccius polli]|uniref:DUF4371 domain-containing protein n=1 Tax=Merluccius polli TaxID=89951 RepID=A0AA47ML18_MERPO|nr:hypothetical protein N1851_020075 [Merluccius polli]